MKKQDKWQPLAARLKKWYVLFHMEISEHYLSTDYAQVFAATINEKVTYFARQSTRINHFICVLRRFHMLRYVCDPAVSNTKIRTMVQYAQAIRLS